MSRLYFHGDEQKLRERLLMLKELVAEQNLHSEPCPLLAQQLTELGVLCKLLQADVRKLAGCVDKALATPDA